MQWSKGVLMGLEDSNTWPMPTIKVPLDIAITIAGLSKGTNELDYSNPVICHTIFIVTLVLNRGNTK